MSQITINLLYKGQHSKAENLDIWLLNLQTRVDKLEKNDKEKDEKIKALEDEIAELKRNKTNATTPVKNQLV